MSVTKDFHSPEYTRITQSRLMHLEKLDIPFDNKTVLEIGAGVGDFSKFLLRKNCSLDSTDGRQELVDYIKSEFKSDSRFNAFFLDMDNPSMDEKQYDVIFCYGLLYHLKKPENAIEFMASRCKEFMILETCVSVDRNEKINNCSEPKDVLSQSIHGIGCRPNREWVFNKLKSLFKHVYVTTEQPDHEQFPKNWKSVDLRNNTRSIFVASNNAMNIKGLTDTLIEQHENQ